MNQKAKLVATSGTKRDKTVIPGENWCELNIWTTPAVRTSRYHVTSGLA
jgi:hypothetical protein